MEDRSADTVTYITYVARSAPIAVTATPMCSFSKKVKFIDDSSAPWRKHGQYVGSLGNPHKKL